MEYIPIIGIANQKGGVGKTTITRLLGEGLALNHAKRVLLIDHDAQCSLDQRYFPIEKIPATGLKQPPINPATNARSSSADIFYGKKPTPYSTRVKNLVIIPADEGKLFEVNKVKRREVEEKIYNQLLTFLLYPEIQKSYDVVVIDLPPDKDSALTISGFKAITHLIIPVEVEIQALEGLEGLLQLWRTEATSRRMEYPLNLLGVLPNKVHSRRETDIDLLEDMRSDPKWGGYIMPEGVELVDRTSFPKADLEMKSIFDFPKSDLARQEAEKVLNYVKGRIWP